MGGRESKRERARERERERERERDDGIIADKKETILKYPKYLTGFGA